MADNIADLPEGMDPADMVRDPHNRPNVWLHKPTDTPMDMGAGWHPSKAKKTLPITSEDAEIAEEEKKEAIKSAFKPFRVEIKATKQRGMVSEEIPKDGDTLASYEILIDGDGDTTVVPQKDVRKLTAAEIKQDEARLAEQNAQQTTG